MLSIPPTLIPGVTRRSVLGARADDPTIPVPRRTARRRFGARVTPDRARAARPRTTAPEAS